MIDFLDIMDRYGVQRAAVFGIPLQQEWNMHMDESRPLYYLNTDGRLYYYSAVDAFIARQYLALSTEQQKRFDPMICGFKPSDGNAVEHIVNMLQIYPGVFSGIGEFTVFKEVVSAKTYGKAVTFNEPALDRIFALAGKVGLVVNIHSDIDAMSPDPSLGGRPRYFDSFLALVKRHPDTTVIWAHTGLGRFVRPSAEHLQLLRMALDGSPNLNMDISWSVLAETITSSKESLSSWSALLSDYPDRFLFGTDAVSPSSEKYGRELSMYDELWKKLPEKVALKVRWQNHKRIFDKANERVRSWEQKYIRELSPEINWPWAAEPAADLLVPVEVGDSCL
ncbi:amidohydrolase family protein [Desulfobotulus mexicanus]|nr:amidohydrolase family protein [Desulfobotulus mexicanus]